MGETYKAVDTRLRCPVALKVIRPGLLGQNTAAHARFLREARTAASVHHPNIARVFHLGELTTGHAFYAMEFIDGETLAERVYRGGSLSISLALEITLQITRALIAASEADLIHRDLKPANLMLTPAGVAACETWTDAMFRHTTDAGNIASDPPLVKVIDFGLARTIKRGADGPLTTNGDFVGTPQYASPEQFGHDTEAIDSRSDIFSLGCTLWFMLIGHPPFSGRSLEEIQRLKERTPSVKVLRATAVPEPVISLLKTMLAPQASKRPQTPKALAKAIILCRKELCNPGGPRLLAAVRPQSDSTISVGWSKHPGWGWVAVVILGIGGIIWSVATRPEIFRAKPAAAAMDGVVDQSQPASKDGVVDQSQPASKITEGSVAVLPFKNLTDQPGNAYFAEGIQNSILTRLTKLASLKVTSGVSTQGYTGESANAAEIARQLGVAYLVEGSVQRTGDTLRVIVRLVRAATAEHVWAESYDGSPGNLLTVESDVVQAVATRLHVPLSGREQLALNIKPTQNPAAYEAYLRGLAFLLRPYTGRSESEEAVKAFQEAVRLDPDFALGWAWLARAAAFAYLRQYYDPKSAMPAVAREAAGRALVLQPDLGEAVLAQGYVLYYCDRDYPRATVCFEQAHRLLPGDSKPLEAHGYVSRRTGRWRQALRDFAQALVLNPRDPALVLCIAESHADLRQFDEALKYYSLAHDLVPENSVTWYQTADIHQGRGDLPGAAAALAQAHPSPDEEPPAKQQEQWLYERRYDLGIAALRTFLARSDVSTDDRILARAHLAWFEEYAGDAAAAREDWKATRAALEPAYHEDTRDSLRFAWLAFARAALGDREGAVAIARTLHRNVAAGGNLIEAPGVEEILARVLVRTGQLDEAAAILETLLTRPYIGMLNASHPVTRASLRLDPQWDPLRREKRFAELFSAPEVPTVFE